jgi:hypothetical protein
MLPRHAPGAGSEQGEVGFELRVLCETAGDREHGACEGLPPRLTAN